MPTKAGTINAGGCNNYAMPRTPHLPPTSPVTLLDFNI